MGYDVHQLVKGRDLWMGGIKLEHELGLLGHSDADVLIHAICDAILGAANMRDIGYHFPDTSADCLNLLGIVYFRMGDSPNAAKYAKLCNELDMKSGDPDAISIKATTTEKLGFTGRQEGISAYAVALIEK